MNTSTSIQALRSARNGLLELHRSLIESEKQVFEKSTGQSVAPGTLLQLLTTDAWFEWLRPFSRLIARIDDAMFDKKQPIHPDQAAAFIKEITDLVSPGTQDRAFGETYRTALQRDPLVAASHGSLLKHLQTN
jgi:hypothetical protein